MNNDNKITLAGLAKLAGVSTSTVSRALNNNPLIKQETRDSLQALAKQHNFSLNRAASRLRTQKTNVIAVILNLSDSTDQSISDPFLLKVVGDLNQALNQHGYEMLLSNSLMAHEDWTSYFINSSRADGIIVVGQGKSTQKIEDVALSGAPLVVWGDPKVNATYPVIGSDNCLGSYLATRHLIEGGCKRIVFLGDPEHAEMSERYKGYEKALAEFNLDISIDLTVSCDITSKAAYEKMDQVILDHGLFFDGIVAASDMVALGALKALKERYINIPNDVGIVGFDDIVMAELFHPSLTTIQQDTKTAANIMVEQLINQLNGQPAKSVVMDIKLITRKSTKSV
ncbi:MULTISPECIES: LacI family DNA-binding transcriptional regulator [Shewanella]|uniref:Transcriptional regulator, LacI family n=1 Tax=Shewanella frigidimarina (strain NCIMB 400) TaxID=318167 RepID=Q07XD2_SHEFN|nr:MULTISPECIES: LacI family DNA-binding transcriptional regulator [Shewanella]ABI73332.1 transcriptional regulator, LacI family [Shewanella frigidimarina NCIMB 400]PKH34644.1 LacI family transcriptional regulator [Shewanella sp. ALD9]PKH99513.1 LacI family transcriptional regulator [Shewanella sp. 11B5]RPA30711.1 LacI family transcriptional regulator [Shewanella frigidimarina]